MEEREAMTTKNASEEIPFTCCGVEWHRSKIALPGGAYQHIGACLKCGKSRSATPEPKLARLKPVLALGFTRGGPAWDSAINAARADLADLRKADAATIAALKGELQKWKCGVTVSVSARTALDAAIERAEKTKAELAKARDEVAALRLRKDVP